VLWTRVLEVERPAVERAQQVRRRRVLETWRDRRTGIVGRLAVAEEAQNVTTLLQRGHAGLAEVDQAQLPRPEVRPPRGLPLGREEGMRVVEERHHSTPARQ